MPGFATLLPRQGRVLLIAAMSVVALGINGPARAQDAMFPLLQDDMASDWRLELAARRSIQSDEQLKILNIGVSVKDRIATIWGSVPTPETSRRAVEQLGKLRGLSSIRNECRIVAVDTLPQAVADAVKNNRAAMLDPTPSANRLMAWPPIPPPPAAAKQMVAKPSAEDQLASPEALAPTPKGDENEAAPGSPLLAPPPATVLLSPRLGSAANTDAEPETIVRADRKFRAVSLENNSGVIRIHGKVARMKDAWELAERLNALPSVKQVILGNISEK